MITIKINKRKLRRLAERICAGIFLITFFLLLGFAGCYETDGCTTGQFYARVIPTLAFMGLATLGLNKLEEADYE